jgi:hypothetical protein
MPGPIRDIRQNVLLTAFETESGSSPVTATFCYLRACITFLEEAIIRNIIYVSFWVFPRRLSAISTQTPGKHPKENILHLTFKNRASYI